MFFSAVEDVLAMAVASTKYDRQLFVLPVCSYSSALKRIPCETRRCDEMQLGHCYMC